MIKKILNEASASAEQAVDNADAGKPTEVSSRDVQLFKILDELYDKNIETFYYNIERLEQGKLPDKNFVNLLIVGSGGTGKTSMLEQWAASRGVNLVTKLTSIMDEADLNGIPTAKEGDTSVTRLATSEFDSLDEPSSVLFLDEFNRGRSTVRGTLLRLIQGHTIPDPSKKGSQKFLPNLLFTIAAINPADTNYNTDPLDDAEKSRFLVYVQEGSDKYEYLDYITGTLQERINFLTRAKNNKNNKIPNIDEKILANERRKALITFLVKDKRFTFDDASDIERAHEQDSDNAMLLTFRTVTQVLYASDGTKDDFLRKYKMGANNQKYEIVREILEKYKEVDDKANQVLDKYKDGIEVDADSNPVGGLVSKKQFRANRLSSLRNKLGEVSKS